MNPDLFEPFEKLIEITVAGERRQVPENNTLLRCFQYLSVDTVSYGDLCWNGDCLNCKVVVRIRGKEKEAVACLVKAEEGMEIVSISDEIMLQI